MEHPGLDWTGETHGQEQPGTCRAPRSWSAFTDRYAQRLLGKVNRALSPSLFPIKGSIAKYQKLPREQQVAVITEAKKVIRKLDNGLLAGSVRELWETHQDPGSSGGGSSSSNQDAAASPPQRRKPKFVASPSPEPLRGKPHHPMRDGLRSSTALAAWSPGK